MKLQEWTEEQLLILTAEASYDKWSEEAGVRYIFFYTPLCGTCKVGERMLEVLLALNPRLPLGKCNINLCRSLPALWKIESIPCLLRWENGIVLDKRYRLSSVDELHRYMNDHLHT